MGEQVEHAVGLLADRRPPPLPLPLAALGQLRFGGALVDVFLQRAPEAVLGLLFGGGQQLALIHRTLGVEDQPSGLRGDRTRRQLLSHIRRPFQLRRGLHGLARPGPGALLVAAQHLLGGSGAFPAGHLAHQVGLQSREGRPRPPHEHQTLTHHVQIHLVQQGRRRTQPLAERRPLGLPTTSRVAAHRIVSRRFTAHLSVTPSRTFCGLPDRVAVGRSPF